MPALINDWERQFVGSDQPHPSLKLTIDHGAALSGAILEFWRMTGKPADTAFRSPWKNGVAERWVGSCRRDLLDHVIVLHERHLKRLMSKYLRYYQEEGTH